MTQLLVVDVGTSGLRAAIVDDAMRIVDQEHRSCPPSIPFDGLVEIDGTRIALLVLDAIATLRSRRPGPLDAVGVTNQRASTLVWDRTTGQPVAPGLGWQDLRTITECITAKAAHDWDIAPNQSITKLAWLLQNTADLADRDLCFGTIDSWIAWTLTGGSLHVSDGTNMSTTMTGLRTPDGREWDAARADHFGIPLEMMPQVVDSSGTIGAASVLEGTPPITALVGDQHASLIGQGCIRRGTAKLTLGTGGMLDLRTDADPPSKAERSPAGTYALPVWALGGELTWGAEGIMLSAGTNVEWLRDDLGLIATSAESHDVASRCTDTDGVMYVPALLGLGTPNWDYGARGTLIGVTRGTERSHVVRAVLDGVAHRGADLVTAAESDTGVEIDTLRVDGGMSQNPTVVQALANVTGVPIEVSPVVDATTLGAAFLAGLGVGVWSQLADAERLWHPARLVEPDPSFDRPTARSRWQDAVARSVEWHPELSALQF
jgi:glycerol kinase